MGSGGKGDLSIFQRVSSPLSNFGLGDFDPLGGMIGQGFENTWNLLSGKEGLASHNSWFGNTYLGQWGDEVVGAPGHEGPVKAEEASNLMWDQAAQSGGYVSPKPEPPDTSKMIARGRPVQPTQHTSLLGEEDDG